jgi:hypothetical protein
MDPDDVAAAHEGQAVDRAGRIEVGADILGALDSDPGDDDVQGQDLALLPGLIGGILVAVAAATALRVGVAGEGERREGEEGGNKTHSGTHSMVFSLGSGMA